MKKVVSATIVAVALSALGTAQAEPGEVCQRRLSACLHPCAGDGSEAANGCVSQCLQETAACNAAPPVPKANPPRLNESAPSVKEARPRNAPAKSSPAKSAPAKSQPTIRVSRQSGTSRFSGNVVGGDLRTFRVERGTWTFRLRTKSAVVVAMNAAYGKEEGRTVGGCVGGDDGECTFVFEGDPELTFFAVILADKNGEKIFPYSAEVSVAPNVARMSCSQCAPQQRRDNAICVDLLDPSVRQYQWLPQKECELKSLQGMQACLRSCNYDLGN